jgi:hypothetical protein
MQESERQDNSSSFRLDTGEPRIFKRSLGMTTAMAVR